MFFIGDGIFSLLVRNPSAASAITMPANGESLLGRSSVMILHEAPSMETTTPKGEWFPCWVGEWSIMENMQQQMWFCFYPTPISMNISSYAYNALRLTPEIWFWAMPFASFQTDVNKCFAIVFPRCQVMSNCDVMSPWVTWQNNRLMISRFVILSREYLLQTALCNQ